MNSKTPSRKPPRSPAKGKDAGPLEMEILGLLQDNPAANVSDIQKALKSGGKSLAYTTVMTVLGRLHQKGFVERTKEGRQFQYSAATGDRNPRSRLLDRVKKTLFRNQRLSPILALLDSEDELSADELRELKKRVEEKLRASSGKTQA